MILRVVLSAGLLAVTIGAAGCQAHEAPARPAAAGPTPSTRFAPAARPRLTGAQRARILLTPADLPTGYAPVRSSRASRHTRCEERLTGLGLGDASADLAREVGGDINAEVQVAVSTTAAGRGSALIRGYRDAARDCAHFTLYADDVPAAATFTQSPCAPVLDESRMFSLTTTVPLFGYDITETYVMFRYGDNVATVGVIEDDGSAAPGAALGYARLMADRLMAQW